MNRLDADHVSVGRGGHAILADVSFAAGPGEFVAVIGPNGAGKSTLLSVLAGLLVPNTGHVTLDGTALAAMPRRALAQKRAYLPQNLVCEWPITVERLVALGLTAHLPAFGDLPETLAAQVDTALRDFDLETRRHQPATTLSGGEFARAMLARAVVAAPDILIVDEPITGLDPRHAMDSMARLSAYAAKGRLVIASLHDLTLAARHATRIVALRNGRIAGEGPLTSALIHGLFDVNSQVRNDGGNVTVNFLPG